MILNLQTAPASEPVTLDETKLHLRVDITTDNDLIEALIQAAREYVEEKTGRALFTQTWDLYLDAFPGEAVLALPRPPLQSVSSITYWDEDGTEGTISASDYQVDTYSEPGRIVLVSGASWPGDTLRNAAGVRVRYVAGWNAVASIPQRYKQAILLLVGHWYENREATLVGTVARDVPLAVDALLWLNRIVQI